MALVDDDEVEEVRRELAEHPVRVLTAVGDGLIQREVDLAARLRLALQLPDRPFTERRDVLSQSRLIDEDVAVGEVEDPRVAVGTPPAAPQLPDDLHRDERLAGAGRHREQQALVAPEHGLHRTVDGRDLVVAGLLRSPVSVAQRAVEREQERVRDRVVRQPLPFAVTTPELVRVGKR
jgi:hypothetical protein